jgi:hypothetical protein
VYASTRLRCDICVATAAVEFQWDVPPDWYRVEVVEGGKHMVRGTYVADVQAAPRRARHRRCATGVAMSDDQPCPLCMPLGGEPPSRARCVHRFAADWQAADEAPTPSGHTWEAFMRRVSAPVTDEEIAELEAGLLALPLDAAPRVARLISEVRRLRRIEAAARAYLSADEDTEEQHPTLGTVRVSYPQDADTWLWIGPSDREPTLEPA